MSIDWDFYLSEMSVSDLHGGGLTLQRVLGADLDRVRLFVHVRRFGTDYPVARRFESRCLDMPLWTEAETIRNMIGRRAAAWLSNRKPIVQMHALRVARAVCARNSVSGKALLGLACPQGEVSLYALEALAKRHPVEYVTWFMDDHLVRWRNGNWQYPPHIEELLGRHLERARAVFVISPAMGRFFHDRFGIGSEVLFGPADSEGDPQWEVRHDDGCIRLGYFGALGPWQLDALGLLAKGLASANASLDIYTGNSSLPEPLQLSQVKLRGRVHPSEVPSAMRQYDAVVLPVSFKPAMRNMSGLNIATKMSESLASGTVTLLIGPRYAAMTQFLEGSGAAVIVSDYEVTAVLDAVARIRDRAERNAVLQSARNLVQTQLSTAAMREIWLNGAARLSCCT